MSKHTDTCQRSTAILDAFQIEIPSWGFANTGTRFGKFVQPGAATSIAEKFADAAEVHRLTGATPSMALHYQGATAERDRAIADRLSAMVEGSTAGA